MSRQFGDTSRLPRQPATSRLLSQPGASSGAPSQPAAALPDASGHFDRFGGRFVPEALYAALLQLEREFHSAMADPAFEAELGELLADYTGRPSPITETKRFSQHAMLTPAG